MSGGPISLHTAIERWRSPNATEKGSLINEGITSKARWREWPRSESWSRAVTLAPPLVFSGREGIRKGRSCYALSPGRRHASPSRFQVAKFLPSASALIRLSLCTHALLPFGLAQRSSVLRRAPPDLSRRARSEGLYQPLAVRKADHSERRRQQRIS
jgi:hypothetical protein